MAAQSLTVIGTVTAIPSGLIPAGANPFGPIAVPDNVSLYAIVSVDTTLHTNPVSSMAIAVDLSMDGGQTWTTNYLGCGRPGGVVSVNSVPLSAMTQTRKLPDGVGRLMRGSLTNSTPIQTGVILTFAV